MSPDLADLRATLVAAGRALVEEGLVARTWGNLSLRVPGDSFLVTPSGLAYGDIEPEDLALVSLADGTWKGRRKPSSERGLHAALYRAHPGTGAIIHSHQPAASAWAAARRPFVTSKGSDAILGTEVPVAPYALPGSRRLAEGVAEAFEKSGSKVVLMANHGAVARGGGLGEALGAARALEAACLGKLGPANGGGRATSAGGDFAPEAAAAALARAASAIGRRRPGSIVFPSSGPWTLAMSREARVLVPVLDDVAQICGLSVRCVRRASGDQGPEFPVVETLAALGPVRGLRRRDAVLLEGAGALCLGSDAGEAEAVALVLEKGCLAYLGAVRLGGAVAIPAVERALMRWYYGRFYRDRGRRA